VIVWMLSVVHALGAGSDGAKLWLRAIALAPMVPIVYLLVVRTLGTELGQALSGERRRRTEAPGRDHGLDQLEVASESMRP